MDDLTKLDGARTEIRNAIQKIDLALRWCQDFPELRDLKARAYQNYHDQTLMEQLEGLSDIIGDELDRQRSQQN